MMVNEERNSEEHWVGRMNGRRSHTPVHPEDPLLLIPIVREVLMYGDYCAAMIKCRGELCTLAGGPNKWSQYYGIWPIGLVGLKT